MKPAFRAIICSSLLSVVPSITYADVVSLSVTSPDPNAHVSATITYDTSLLLYAGQYNPQDSEWLAANANAATLTITDGATTYTADAPLLILAPDQIGIYLGQSSLPPRTSTSCPSSAYVATNGGDTCSNMFFYFPSNTLNTGHIPISIQGFTSGLVNIFNDTSFPTAGVGFNFYPSDVTSAPSPNLGSGLLSFGFLSFMAAAAKGRERRRAA